MDLLTRNLEALLRINPLLTAKLFELRENSLFDVYVDQDPANINIIAKSDITPMYHGKPIIEVQQSFDSLKPYERYPYLYFFGLGNGILYKMLLNNSMHKQIVVFEPELEIIYIVLNLIDFSDEIIHKKIRIELSSDMTFDYMVNVVFNGTAKLYAKVYDLLITCPFYDRYFDEMKNLNSLAVESLKHLAYSIGNDIIDSLIGVEHHIRNLPRMLEGPTLYEAIQKGKNTSVAVIVSTGPSLAKQLPLLKKYQRYVTIFSLDASFPILSANNIKPDMVFSIERVAATAEFYKKTPTEAFKNVNFMISSVAHKELIDNIKEGTLQLNMRPFDFLRNFRNDQWGYIGSGMSSANMAFEFAALAQFDKIVLIGQDLAYAKDGLSHSQGHIFGHDEVKPKSSDLYTTAYGGDGEVKTTLIWKMFKNFFEITIAQLNGIGKIQTYNATEGGARIEGTIETSFEHFLLNNVDTKGKKKAIKLKKPLKAMQRQSIKSALNAIDDYFEEGLKVKKACETVFLEVAAELEIIEMLKDDNRLEEVNFDHLLELNTKIDTIKELFEEEKFNQLHGTIMMPLMLHQEIELATIMVRNVENDLDKKIKLIDWIYAHKFWLFSMAGSIDNTLEKIAQNVSNWDHQSEYKKTIQFCEDYLTQR